MTTHTSEYWRQKQYDQREREKLNEWRRKHDLPDEFLPEEEALATEYVNLRNCLSRIEEIYEQMDGSSLRDSDDKRLDKAVSLAKIGAKFLKQVLRSHGFRFRRTPRITLLEAVRMSGEQSGTGAGTSPPLQ